MRRQRTMAPLAFVCAQCGRAAPAGNAVPAGNWWKPTPGTSWQWQVSGTLDTSVNASVYDVDLFHTAPAQIAARHAQGRRVVCYFDPAGEPGRPDSVQLEPYRGSPVVGWPGQYWLDIRAPVVAAVMKARIALSPQKQCDAVEAEDVEAR